MRAAAIEAAVAATAAVTAAAAAAAQPATPLAPAGPSGATSTPGRSAPPAVEVPGGLNATSGTDQLLTPAEGDPGPPSPRSDTLPVDAPLGHQPITQSLSAIEESRDEETETSTTQGAPVASASETALTPRSKSVTTALSPLASGPVPPTESPAAEASSGLGRTGNSSSSTTAAMIARSQSAKARTATATALGPGALAAAVSGISVTATPPMSPAVGTRGAAATTAAAGGTPLTPTAAHATAVSIAAAAAAGGVSGATPGTPVALPSQQVQQARAAAAAHALLQDEIKMLTLQLADFKDRIMYLQQELTEEKARHDATIASRRQLEERLSEITSAVSGAAHGGGGSRQGWRNSSGGGLGGAGAGGAGSRDLHRAQSQHAHSPMRPGGDQTASGHGDAPPTPLRDRTSGLSAVTEHSLSALQDLIAKLRDDKDSGLAAKQKEADGLKQKLEAAQKVRRQVPGCA